MSGQTCSRCGSGEHEPGKRFDDQGRPLHICSNCGHVDGGPVTAAPAGEPILLSEGCYRRTPVHYDD